MKVTVDIDVDVGEVLEDADTKDLAMELICRKDWKDAIAAALKLKAMLEDVDFDDSTALDDLLRDYSLGFPVNEQLSALCRQRLGLTIPVRN